MWHAKLLADRLTCFQKCPCSQAELDGVDVAWSFTVRNPSAENLRVQRSRDPHQKKTAPECISSIAFLNATICPPMSLSQGTKYFGACIHPSSYQCLHCLKPDCLHHIPCCFALPPCLAGHPNLWKSPACFRHNSFSGYKDIP